jgi:hypothetical protein
MDQLTFAVERKAEALASWDGSGALIANLKHDLCMDEVPF